MWSVNIHHEVIEDDAITVLSADCVQTFCESCALARDFPKTEVPLKSLN